MRKLRFVLSGIFLLLAVLFFISFMKKMFPENRGNTLDKANNIYDSDICYFINDYLYVTNTTEGILQIFDIEGNFVTGYILPSDGGNVLCGADDIFRLYCVRSHTELEFFGVEYTSKTVQYNNPQEFFETFGKLKNSFNPDNGIVKFEYNNSIYEIKLEADTGFMPAELCIVLFGICYIAFLIVSGLYKKIIH